MVILALDPGETTGYAWGTIKEGKFIYEGAGEGEYDEQALWGMLCSISPETVVAEGFEFRQRVREGLVLYSRNLLGVSQLWTAIRDRNYVEQSAAQGKSFFTDDKLRGVRAYQKGLRHSRDATRHLFWWAFFGEGQKLVNENWHQYKERINA